MRAETVVSRERTVDAIRREEFYRGDEFVYETASTYTLVRRIKSLVFGTKFNVEDRRRIFDLRNGYFFTSSVIR